MYNVIVVIDDRPRGEIVRLQVDLDRRVDALIEWYVAQFGLPRRYFDLGPIEYRLLRAADKRAISGKRTLRQAGVTEGDLLQLLSREGRLVWRTAQAMLDEIEGELRGRLVDETWDRVTEKLAQIEATEMGSHRVQQVRRLVDKAGGPAKLIDIGDKLGEALDIYRAAGTWAKRGLAAMSLGGSSILVTGTLLLGNLMPGTVCEPVPPVPTDAPIVLPAPTQTETATPTNAPTSTPTATETQTPTATLTPTPTPTSTPTPTPSPTRKPKSVPKCLPERPRGWVAYIVRCGDTLFSLASSTGTTVAAIQRANCLRGSLILCGERLWLPAIPEPDPITPTPTPTPLPQPPDLIVRALNGLRVSCSETGDDCVSELDFTIANAGAGSAGGFAIRTAFDPEQKVIVNRRASGLAPGAAQEFTVTTDPGGNCYDPDCSVCVLVDSGNDVRESNERNNRLCATSIGKILKEY